MAILSVKKELPDGLIQLREPDEAECQAAGLTGDAAVRSSASLSDYFDVVYVDGDLAAAWGYVSAGLFGYRCRAWLLTMPVLDKYPIRFTRASLRVLGFLFETFEEIEIAVDTQHTAAMKWLAWLGFNPIARHNRFVYMLAKRESARWVS